MKSLKKPYLGIAITLVVFLLATSLALAQPVGGYDLSWWTIESGGPTNGGGYNLHGVIGQPDRGVLSGGRYSLVGGFLSRFSVSNFLIFVPLILR